MAENADVPLGQISVLIDNVSVTYRTTTEAQGLRSIATRTARALLRGNSDTKVHALRNLSLTVREGEHVGIVGSNGSGKSTLLRAIAGVQPTDGGQVLATSTPVLLGVQAALIPALSGRKNVRLGLLALGFTPVKVEALTRDVIALAGIEDAIDRPMATYSSGMAARLRFSIAAAARPAILLIDEALGTGDAAFAARSTQAINDLRADASTVFLVSHAAETIETMCTRAIWLHKGTAIADGNAALVARTYRLWAWRTAQQLHDEADEILQKATNGYLVAESERR